ncbi:MAG TPA: hypothetical protein VGQ62_19750 [Chloroflexota bacterium]|jgi:hypothetical protein|nr:hypothetical protein [Chloroflexota bacterium]
MAHNTGPEQTESWPLVWADLDLLAPPAWIVWDRACEVKAADGQACPRRAAGLHFGLRRCSHHWPSDVRLALGRLIG